MGTREAELERTCRDGEYIVREGERSREMFVIQLGKVRITKLVNGVELELATLSRGDFFGEMSVLESLPRDASAIAVGETKLLSISTGALLVRIRRDPTFACELLYRLSGRIRALNAKWVAALENQSVVERTSLMFFVPETAVGKDEAPALPEALPAAEPKQ
jgi:CRP/FNR family transcriptional regulator, cyclic AMP receptor protein